MLFERIKLHATKHAQSQLFKKKNFVSILIKKMDHRYFLKSVNFPGTILIGYAINDLGHREYFVDRIRINSGHTISFNFSHSDKSF